MNCRLSLSSFVRRLSAGVGAVAVVCLLAGSVQADPIVRIEEDWEVKLNEPDLNDEAPQMVFAMSTTDRLADVHTLFELNHRSLPDYVAGGMNLQCWSGDINLDYNNGPKLGAMQTPSETVTFTLRMKLESGNVIFEVVDGNSTTWGEFGGQGYLRSEIPTPQTEFTLYSPEVSKKNSYVSYAGHRVHHMVIKRVRYYTAVGLVYTDYTDRYAHYHDISP